MQSLPFVAQEMGVLQLTAIFGILWELFFLQQFLRRPTASHGFGLAAGVPILFFTCGYYGLFGAIFIPPAVWGLCPPSPRMAKQIWGRLIFFVVLGGLLAAPLLITQRQILAEHNFSRSETTIRKNSASPADYLKTLDSNIFYKKFLHRPAERGQRLFPGWVLLALAIIGAVFPPKPAIRRGRWYLLGAATLAFGLSLGSTWSIGGWEPYQIVRQFVPGMAELRSPFRFAVVVQLALALLAGCGLAAIWRLPRHSRWVAGTLAAAAIIESLALPMPLHAVPPIRTEQPWQQWLTARAETPRVVLLPFAKNGSTAAFEQTTRWMLETSSLDMKLLNGYSGFFPRAHSFLRAEMADFPTPESIHLLKKYQADYVVVFHFLPDTPTRAAVAQFLPPVFYDADGQVSVFAVR